MCTILCLLNWNFWWIIMVPHHGGGDMLAQVWSWNENLSTYFTDEIFVVNHLYLLRVTQYTAKRGYKQRLSSETQMTNADVMQHFGRVWRSTWSLLTGERLSACEICIKPFFSGHNLKMHIKAQGVYLRKCLTNADIEEIVTNISPNPQSWRYISFSTAERSPKCNSTQEKSLCEHCVEIV